jgi:Photosynthetic reaction centre protein
MRTCLRLNTSTDDRLYILSTTVLIIAFVTAPPVDIDGTREPVAGSLLYGDNIISRAVIPSSPSIGIDFYPIWETSSTMVLTNYSLITSY